MYRESRLKPRSFKISRSRVIAIGFAALIAVFAITINSTASGGPFNPVVTFQTSTTQATAHPDARITITNGSSENIREVAIDLPKGMWGSMAAADECAYATAAAGNCTNDSRVGTVKASAIVDSSDVVLRGNVYLTAPHPDFVNSDPAWLSIKIDPDIGGVTSFDPIITPARVIPRYLTQGVKLGQPIGIRTQIGNIAGHPEFDIPQSVTDSSPSPRTIDFNLKSVAVDLRSNQVAPDRPLLTNPSSCAAGPVFSASFVGHNNTAPAASEIPYQATGCSNVKFRPADASFALSDPRYEIDNNTGLTGTVEFSDDSASISETKLRLPPVLTFNSAAYPAGSYCSPSSIPSAAAAVQFFDPSLCPANGSAVVGTATIETPLLSDPLNAKIYIAIVGSLPSVIIHASHDVDPSNPAGITVSIVGRPTAVNYGACPASYSSCPSTGDAFHIAMVKLPDTPVKKITIDMAKPGGWRAGGHSAELLQVMPEYSPECRPIVGFTTEFTSHSGATAARTSSQAVSDCANGAYTAEVSLGTSGTDVNPTDTTPAIPFSPTPTDCVFGSVDAFDVDCASPASPSSALSPGLQVFSLSDDGSTPGDYRTFSVQHPLSLPESDVTPPTVTIDSGPSDPTSDIMPSFEFSAAGGPVLFQCSMNGDAFLPCGDSSPGTSGEFTVAAEDAFIPGSATNEFSVRAVDAAGNVSTADSFSFEVDVPFEPSFNVDLSTTTARAHPQMDMTITSGSHEDLKDLQLSMPDGFFGGLSSVPELCPLATANAGACTSSSQIGTVETEAVVEESTIRLPGKVFLTDPIQVGDPAGLFVTVPAKLQDVDLGSISVPIRLSVRGQVQGLDSRASNLPDRVTPTNGIDTETEFDLRSIVLKLRDNPAAGQPLLTNPSKCGGSAFSATFTGDATPTPTTTTETVAFAATDCGSLGFSSQVDFSIVDATTGKAPKPTTSDKSVSANLTAVVRSNPGDSGLRDVSVLLPKPVTINVAKLPIACSLAQYQAGGAEGCPASSRIGTVQAESPLLREPLYGNVYLIDHSERVLPELLLALRGPISTDIIGSSRFENLTQIRTNFTNLPDVPLASFKLVVNALISTLEEACTVDPTQWNATGTLTSFNERAVTVSSPLAFDCGTVSTAKFKARRSKSTLTLRVTPPSGTKLRSVAVKMPKGIKLVKKNFTKKTVFQSGRKKLKSKCAKFNAPNKFTVNFCKRAATSFTATFKAGSLKVARRAKKPTFIVTTVDGSGKKKTFSVASK